MFVLLEEAELTQLASRQRYRGSGLYKGSSDNFAFARSSLSVLQNNEPSLVLSFEQF